MNLHKMNKKQIKITILGAGISGLAIAHRLEKAGFEITLLEKKDEPGGSMETTFQGGFPVDFGPNSGLDTSPLIKELIKDVGLENEMIYANQKGDKRYILKNNQLYPLPTNPIAFIKTKLFSAKAKICLLAEPFIKKSNDGYYQTISTFVERRLGREFLDYAINPFVAGVFAGDPDKLSVKSAFPKLYRLEEVYGGLIKGMIKGAKERNQRAEQSKQNAKMFSFKMGMQSFPRAISEKLEKTIKYNCTVDKILKSEGKYKIVYTQNDKTDEIITDIVISAIPAYQLEKVFEEIDAGLIPHLKTVYYPPVKVLYLGFKKKDIGRKLDGFGFLIPEKEKKSFLGAIWSSVIFPNRTDDDKASFTLFIGGSRSPELFEEESSLLIARVIKEFKGIMEIKNDPILIKERMWAKAIPQYHIGYIELERYFEKVEIKNPGIFLRGNFRGGISIGDCIINSELTCNRVLEYLRIVNLFHPQS